MSGDSTTLMLTSHFGFVDLTYLVEVRCTNSRMAGVDQRGEKEMFIALM
eukprot:CAMPEP_0172023434 /NCGR_PEP_ID=MMETSP1041-20130122/14790_1 /TAXON_ID=464988 /ORGANISM="Hemiselmis andersenii, Strain CCMP439" /LENGTH=48 /DNA_ID= /DNA_START= /DNA_END= /DNA_ORIENTATION=